jgi:hypothetical protein
MTVQDVKTSHVELKSLQAGAVSCNLCYTLFYMQVDITFILKLPVPCPVGTVSGVPGGKAAGVRKLTTTLCVGQGYECLL